MVTSGAKYTPTFRWKGRLHRENSTPEYYMTRPTFEILRQNTVDGLEDRAFNSIRDSLTFSEDGEWMQFTCTQATPSGDREVPAAVNTTIGLVAIRSRTADFSGEGLSNSIIVFHFLCDENDPGWESAIDAIKQPDGIKPDLSGVFDDWYGGIGKYYSTSMDGILNPTDFDTRLYKLLPTDLIVRGDREGMARYVRSEISEVRISNDPLSASKEQSSAFDLIDLGVSPEVHVTGRPGSGKTTIASVAVAEVALQRGPKRGNRKILYVTTTSELADQARREVESLIKNVYNDKRGIIYESLRENLYIESRDSMIKTLGQEGQRLDQHSLERIIEEAGLGREFNVDLLGTENQREDDKKHLRFLLRNPEILRRALVNMVYGLFGSVDRYLSWYEDAIRGSGEVFYWFFKEAPLNFSFRNGDPIPWEDEGTGLFWKINPEIKDKKEFSKQFNRFVRNDDGSFKRGWTQRLTDRYIRKQLKVRRWRAETLPSTSAEARTKATMEKIASSSQSGGFTISDFWDPYEPFSDQEPEIQMQSGRSLLAALSMFLKSEDLGGRLHQSGGDGLWTHSGVLDSLYSNFLHETEMFSEQEQIKWTGSSKPPLWHHSNINDFDAIILDESQDFTPREISIFLEAFSNRAPNAKGIRNSRNGLPFLFFSSGDPLQTIEGNIFDPRNQHIQSIAYDWKLSLSEASDELNADLLDGLASPTRKDLSSNYRNASPIVENAVNPLIGEIRKTSIAMGKKRTIGDQSAASSRRGLVIRSRVGGEESEPKFQIQKALIEQLSSQIEKVSQDHESLPDPSVVLILPLENLQDRESILNVIPDHYEGVKEALQGLWASKKLQLLEKRGDIESINGMNAKAGIYAITSIKGLTVPAAIAVGFSKRVAEASDNGDDNELVRMLSHYLVAVSRPQFVLLVDEGEEELRSEGELVITESGEIEVEELKRVLSRQRINLDPSIHFDKCMSSPTEVDPWDMLTWSLDRLSARDKSQDSAPWEEVRAFTNWCKEIHGYHGEDDFYTGFSAIEPTTQRQGDHIQSGSRFIDREHLCSAIARSDLKKYFAWRALLEDPRKFRSDPDRDVKEILEEDEELRDFARLALNGAHEGLVDSIVPDSRKFGAMTPFERSNREKLEIMRRVKETILSNNIETISHSDDQLRDVEKEIEALEESRSHQNTATSPRWEDSNIVLNVPQGWFFDSGKIPMKHRNSWSTPLDSILDSIGVHSDSDAEVQLQRVRWFLCASRDPYRLFDCIEDCFSIDAERGTILGPRAMDWVIQCMNSESEESKLNRAFRRWLVDGNKSTKISKWLRYWLTWDRKGATSSLESIRQACSHCGVIDFEIDDVKGEMSCRACGAVVSDDPYYRPTGTRYRWQSHESVNRTAKDSKSSMGNIDPESFRLMKEALGGNRQFMQSFYRDWKSSGQLMEQLEGMLIFATSPSKYDPSAKRPQRYSVDQSTSEEVGEMFTEISRFLSGNDRDSRVIRLIGEFSTACSSQDIKTLSEKFIDGTRVVCQDGPSFTMAEYWVALMCSQLNLSSTLEYVNQTWFDPRPEKSWEDGVWRASQPFPRQELEAMLSSVFRGSDFRSPYPDYFDSQWERVCANFEAALADATDRTLFAYLSRLYISMVESGGESRMRDHPLLSILLNLHLRAKIPVEVDALPYAMRSIGNYREGHRFWRTLDEKRRKDMMEARGMTINYEHLPKDRRVSVRPLFAMVPYPSHDKYQFSASDSGNIGYLLLREGNDESDLKRIRNHFRVAGAYREAAVVGLARSVLMAMDAAPEERDQILRRAMVEALLERPGIYKDHVMSRPNWAPQNFDKDLKRNTDEAPDKQLKRLLDSFLLSHNKKSGKFGNSIPTPMTRGTGRSPPKSFKWLERDKVAQGIMTYVNQPSDNDVVDKEGKIVKASEKGRAAVAAIVDYEGEIHQSIRSVEKLLPYLFFSQEVIMGQEIEGASWFQTQPELEMIQMISTPLAAMKFLNDKLLPSLIEPDTTGLVRNHSREELAKAMAGEGDIWMLNLSRELVGAPEWSDDRLARFADRLLSMPKPRGLRRMVRKIGIIDSDSELAIGDSSDADKIATLEAANEELRVTLASVQSLLKERGLTLDDLTSLQPDEDAGDSEE